jgi:hypothetical protein
LEEKILLTLGSYPKTDSPTQSPSMSPTSPTKSPSISPTVLTWTQRGADIDGEASGDFFGGSVSFSADGTTVAIGARYNAGAGSESGHVRVYDWDGTNWTQRGADIDGEALYDLSGQSVSLSNDGNTVAIGAPQNDGNGNDSGHVRVYDWDGTSWTQRGSDINGEAGGDYSGHAVSLSDDGNTVAIGAILNGGFFTCRGHVRVYDWDGSNWTQRGSDIDAEAVGDFSGQSVSLSSDSNTVAIGASWNNGNGSDSGHVRVYDWDGTNWTQRGQDIDGEAAFDGSGYSVSLSDDGNTVAIGAPYNGDNGECSGHVRVYDWDGTNWTQRGADIDGEYDSDEFGASVSLSGNGNTVAIGSANNREGQGHVRVFDWNGTSWTQRYYDIEADVFGLGFSVSLSNDGNSVAIGAVFFR